MLLTTTDGFAGRTIATYLGLVVGIHLSESRLQKTFSSGGIRGISVGKPHSYGDDLADCLKAAEAEVVAKATTLGADGVVGIDVDYQLLGDESHLVMVSISGTAVTLA
jgi:uncharacterized protein YbjQ (UPF0145 family)